MNTSELESHLASLEKLIQEVKGDSLAASLLGQDSTDDAKDHMMQAHFRLTEALAHLRVARGSLRQLRDQLKTEEEWALRDRLVAIEKGKEP